MKQLHSLLPFCFLLLTACGGGSSGSSNSGNETPTPNKEPTVSLGADRTITVGEDLSITFTASDSDGQIVAYTVIVEGVVIEETNISTQTGNEYRITIASSFLPLGQTDVSVSVSDNDSAVKSDSILVTATSTPVTPPTTTDPSTPTPPTTPSPTVRHVFKTGQVTTYTNPVFGTNYLDDGFYQSGAETSYSDNGETVTDNVTGLEWQKGNDGVNDTLTNTYTYCRNLNYAGKSDWRLPNYEEIYSIMHRGSSQLYESVFVSKGSYWSIERTPNILGTSEGSQHDSDGRDKSQFSGDAYTRCVRGEPLLRKGIFTRDDTNETVVDSTTDLMWTDTGNFGNISDAIETCSSLSLAGFSDWRLANINELASLVVSKGFGNSLDDAFVFNLISSSLLSSTHTGSGAPHYWFITGNGAISKDVNAENRSFSFKCVRDN